MSLRNIEIVVFDKYTTESETYLYSGPLISYFLGSVDALFACFFHP